MSVQVVATNPSLEFYKRDDIEKTGTRVWTDADEWTVKSLSPDTPLVVTEPVQGTFKIGDPIPHIELRRWADIVLVAPCSANTLSKIAYGQCDNLAVTLDVFLNMSYAN